MEVELLEPDSVCVICGHNEVNHALDGCHVYLNEKDHPICPCGEPARDKDWAYYDSTGE